MQYKGDDMDLRVPHARTPRESYPGSDLDQPYTNGRWRPAGSATPEPLWVDETVLACCNTAFDMAMAHGSSEVELEHLVHAITRVEGAARVLEARGVREGQLRRDSAALMASDVPTNLATDRVAPRRAADVEDALRRAVEIAARRGMAAGIDDLLWVLLHYARDVPAIQLLRRHTPDWQRPDWGRGYETASHAVDVPRYVAPQPEPPRYVPPPEPPRYVPPMPAEPMRFAPTGALDHVAHRLGTLEDGMRALHAELSTDRKALTELIRDMQRDIVAHRGDAAALRNDLGQRLEMLERGLQVRGDAGRIPAQLAERVQQLEKSVQSGMSEGARNWAALGQRLTAFESQLAAPRDMAVDHQPMLDRLALVETAVDARVTDIGRGVATLTDRLVSIERIAESSAGEGARRWASLTDRLGSIETYLASRSKEPQAGINDLTERLSGLERAVRAGFGEAARQGQSVMDRVGDVEKYVASLPSDQGEGALLIDERLAGLESRLDAGLAGQSEMARRIMSQLTVLESRPAGDATLPASTLAQLSAPLADRLAGIERTSLQQSAEGQVALAELSGRLVTMERTISQSVASQDEAVRARDREIADMHDALIRLGENQHTLASAISDWRQENHNRLAAVTAQLDRVMPPEIVAQMPADGGRMPTMVEREAIAAGRDSLQTEASVPAATMTARDGIGADTASTLDREPSMIPQARGRGFWWWLFGTDDVSRSNRESELRWERMHRRIQEARLRRREKA
ncbi:MAG: Clp protease N-terminal domain-containing protein [Hyphomicrobiaceae bacterium]